MRNRSIECCIVPLLLIHFPAITSKLTFPAESCLKTRGSGYLPLKIVCSFTFKTAETKMTNNTNYKNSSNIFRSSKGNSRSPHSLGPIPKPSGLSNPWAGRHDLPRESDLKRILFLSKRGMSRSPIAREVMRSLLEKSDFAGEVIVFSAGVTKAYDDCPIDKRIREFCHLIGYRLQTNSRFANPSILGKSDLVITLDHG